MTVIFDGTLFVHYGFIWLSAGSGNEGGDPDVIAARGGQTNGLLGAAQPCSLSVFTATHTGNVRVRIEAREDAAELDDEWDDVVEASFEARTTHASLTTFDGHESVELPAATGYRARLCCSGWDEAANAEAPHPDAAVDHYLLQLWPAPPGPDAILRERSAGARYWHEVARSTPPPPPQPDRIPPTLDPRTPDEIDADARRWERFTLLQTWGGVPPDDRLLSVGHSAQNLAATDRALVDLAAAADPAAQRALAVWAAHRVCARASGRLDWATALAAAESGLPLPPPFDDRDTVLDIAWGPTTGITIATVHAGPDSIPRQPVDPTVSALAALEGLGRQDPLRAALECVDAGRWSEPDEGAYLDEVRSRLRRRG